MVVAVLVTLGCAACSSSPYSAPKAAGPGRVPADATRVVTSLVSRDPATLKKALAISYSAYVNAAAVAPAGTRISVQPGTWQQHGGEARLRALVTVPGRSPVTEMIYLVREEGQWRVLFTDVP